MPFIFPYYLTVLKHHIVFSQVEEAVAFTAMDEAVHISVELTATAAKVVKVF